jgi:hypothetical protein
MLVAALVSFGLLVVAWLVAPSAKGAHRLAEIRAPQDTAVAPVPVEVR